MPDIDTPVPETRRPTLCIFCRQPVMMAHASGYGTYWTHTDGYQECRPTYASPNFFT